MKITFDPHTFGGYYVLVDGQRIGSVTKNVQHYNLRRHVTSTTWVPRNLNAVKVPGYFTTRKAAVAALVSTTDVAKGGSPLEHEHVWGEGEIVDGPSRIGEALTVCLICGTRP